MGASRKSQKPRHYDKFLVGAELDGVKWTSQKLYSSKLTKISGMMMCDLGISAMKDPFLVAFAFRVDVDRVKHLIKKEEERPPSEGDEKPAKEGITFHPIWWLSHKYLILSLSLSLSVQRGTPQVGPW